MSNCRDGRVYFRNRVERLIQHIQKSLLSYNQSYIIIIKKRSVHIQLMSKTVLPYGHRLLNLHSIGLVSCLVHMVPCLTDLKYLPVSKAHFACFDTRTGQNVCF